MIKPYIFVVMYSLASAVAVQAQMLTIDSCYALAVRHYPLTKQYELIAASKEYTLSNASKAYLPQVSFTAIEGYVFGDFPSLGGSESTSNFKFIGLAQINQTLWDGGATRTQKGIIKASAETDKASVDVALHDLRSRVNELYFGVLLVDEQVKQLEVQNAVLTNNINRVKQLSDNGLAYKTDVDEIKVEQLKLNQQKTSFKYTRSGYLTMLSLLIGVRIDDRTGLQKPLSDSSHLLQTSIDRPELLMYKNQRNLITAQAGMQRVSVMPKLGLLGAGVMLAPGLSASGASTIGVAGLSASWNLGGLYKNNNEKQLTQQALKKIDVQEETFLFNTKLRMTQTSAHIEKQKAILAEDNEIVKLRQTIREGYQVKYDAGAGPLLDLLNSTEKESEARAQKAMHEMQLLMTLYDYLTITGN